MIFILDTEEIHCNLIKKNYWTWASKNLDYFTGLGLTLSYIGLGLEKCSDYLTGVRLILSYIGHGLTKKNKPGDRVEGQQQVYIPWKTFPYIKSFQFKLNVNFLWLFLTFSFTFFAFLLLFFFYLFFFYFFLLLFLRVLSYVIPKNIVSLLKHELLAFYIKHVMFHLTWNSPWVHYKYFSC